MKIPQYTLVWFIQQPIVHRINGIKSKLPHATIYQMIINFIILGSCVTIKPIGDLHILVHNIPQHSRTGVQKYHNTLVKLKCSFLLQAITASVLFMTVIVKSKKWGKTSSNNDETGGLEESSGL